MITIVDYGMGNLRSVLKAFEWLGASARISSDPREVEGAEKLVLPGVGAFPAAMRELSSRRLIEPLKTAIAKETPYLGICLGLQLLFERSDEGEGAAGLGILEGAVKRFAPNGTSARPLKIPHMGWNQIARASRRAECPLLTEIPDQSFVYFVHSYYGQPADASVVALETEYGTRFTSMIWRDHLFATQFHPEKSQAIGLRLLKNFVDL
jgi:glutamine amidotransferase